MKTTKKYELIKCDKPGLFRIQALRDIPRYGIVKGAKGGYVAGEHNLSQTGDCWIMAGGMVTQDATVRAYALIGSTAVVADSASIGDAAIVLGRIMGHGRVHGYSYVAEQAVVGENASVRDNAKITDWAQVTGEAAVHGQADISGHAKIMGNARIKGTCVVDDTTVVAGHVMLQGMTMLPAGSKVTCPDEVITVHGLLPHPITVVKGQRIRIGCTSGTAAWFRENMGLLARRHGYTKSQVRAVSAFAELMLNTVRRPPRKPVFE